MRIFCAECGRPFEAAGARGRTPRFCGAACKKREYRRRVCMPASMRSVERWCRADGKRPIMRDGSPASSTNPSTWTSWWEVQAGAGDGFGFMLGEGFGCLDLDHCLSGDVVADWALGAVRSLEWPQIFCEKSVSGEGLHIFVEAPEMPGSKQGGVEFYSRSRFIRMTGKRFEVKS